MSILSIFIRLYSTMPYKNLTIFPFKEYPGACCGPGSEGEKVAMTRRQSLLVTVLLLLSLLIPLYVLAQTLSGKVISVADGDTITILTNTKQQVKIRLYGIDTPESGQAFGQKAKQFTSSLVYGKQVEVKAYDTDKYGRTVGVVLVNGQNVNEAIIRAGYAWQYRKYCKESFCPGWLDLEDRARTSKIGLWYDKNPAPPWEWRKTSKGSNTVGNTSPLPSASSGTYHGNIKSHVLHAPGCQHYNCKNCTATFSSVDEAMRAGYRVHEQCVK